ncbi:hypothetical protein GCM10011588_15340 [Nocardia jinanensis]|uniref:Uncharacterized protein n=1 Tax=Nocardia jinanensis TaxID=382504 RepID=A0A917RCS9_9NOCA|nr:hypothetical protein GCM10011588_15340 [Nocardia jinanensis]
MEQVDSGEHVTEAEELVVCESVAPGRREMWKRVAVVALALGLVATTVAASIRSAFRDEVVVMLFVDAEISNITTPAPRIDRNRILMTMNDVGGRWLASRVELL